MPGLVIRPDHVDDIIAARRVSVELAGALESSFAPPGLEITGLGDDDDRPFAGSYQARSE
jgi:hypothetical protein